MKRATLVSKGTLNRIFQEVNETWKQCNFPLALELLERARQRDPANIDILLNLGRLHGLRYDYTAAENCFERALRVSGQKTEVLAAAARESRSFNHFELAERYLKMAMARKDVTSDTLVMLAEIHERQRKLDEAASLTDQVLCNDPNCAAALLLRVRLDRQSGQLEAAERRLRAIPANAEPSLRVNSKYELGNILDRQGRYDEAMSAFLEAKSLLLPQAGRPARELKIMRTRISHLTTHASADVLKEWFTASDQLQPSHRLTLLGGHPRSGTTLLEQVLDAHPDMVSAEETEIFQNDAYGLLLRGQPDDISLYSGLAEATPETLKQSRQNYFHAMELSLGQPMAGRLLIDKNPSYTFLMPALIRIFPEIKFLIALRDPRDVVLSCFMQNLPLNQIGAAFLTLEGAVEDYNALMTVWQTIAPRMSNPHLEIRYEDMVEDLESVARKTLDFLGVEWDATVLSFDAHARQKVVRSPTYADVTKPVYKGAVGRWRNYRKHLEPHLEMLEPFVKAFGYE